MLDFLIRPYTSVDVIALPHSKKPGVLSAPIPTKFFGEESAIIAAAIRNTGLNRSEIVRRSIRLLGRQQKVMNSYNFVAELILTE